MRLSVITCRAGLEIEKLFKIEAILKFAGAAELNSCCCNLMIMWLLCFSDDLRLLQQS